MRNAILRAAANKDITQARIEQETEALSDIIEFLHICRERLLEIIDVGSCTIGPTGGTIGNLVGAVHTSAQGESPIGLIPTTLLEKCLKVYDMVQRECELFEQVCILHWKMCYAHFMYRCCCCRMLCMLQKGASRHTILAMCLLLQLPQMHLLLRIVKLEVFKQNLLVVILPHHHLLLVI